MFLKVDNSEYEFNLKARLNVETKQNLRNALHKKTRMLIYLLRLSDMINTVLLLRHVTVALFKVFLMDYTERFSSLTIHFHERNYERNLFLSKLFQFFTRNSKAKLIYTLL